MPINEAGDFYKDFASGDLIYGTQIDRERYFSLAERKSTMFTIDQLTRQMDHELRGWGDYAKEELTPGEFERLPHQAQAFLTYARKTTFWKKMKGSGVSNYTRTGVAKARIGLGNKLQWSEAYFRAKCKAGIGFVLESGYCIRFVLDSLNDPRAMEAIVRKESDQPWHTGSELRYLYKKREHRLTQDKVVFYVDGDRVDPPWIKFSGLWGDYGNTRLDDDHHVPEFARR